MSPERRAEVALVLSDHQWEHQGCKCKEPCTASFVVEQDAWIAMHQLDMLVAAGFELFRPNAVVPSEP
jgi:hypothetical protein